MKTVLVIDDDPVIREMYMEALSDAGWQTTEAPDGETGISMAVQLRPSAVVCDLLMPRCNGFQVCRALRSHRELAHMPIVVTSGRSYDSDRQGALDAGADAYLVKPVDLDELTAIVDRLTAWADAPPPPGPASASTEGADGPAKVRFWGVRGSIATPGRGTVKYGGNTACVSVRADGEIIVLDAGTGIRGLGKQLAAEFQEQPMALTVLVSHTHWDHIQGFPFFMPAYNPRNSIRVIGFEGSRTGLEATLSSQMESPYFPVGLKQMPGNLQFIEQKDLRFNIGRVKVQAWFLNHPGVCMGYRLNCSAGSVAYVPDNEPLQRHRVQVPGLTSPKAGDFARGEDAKLIEFVKGVDVLIIDAQYDAQEYETRRGWGHACVDDVVGLALDAQVKKLFLFHHDPDHDDDRIDQFVEHARNLVQQRGGTLEVEAAQEDLEIVLTGQAARA